MQIYQRLFMITFVIMVFWVFSANCAPRRVYVKTAPPAVKVEVKPAPPYADAVWMPGHWSWYGNEYVWVSGRWTKPNKGYVWIPGHWAKKPRGWVWIDGHWRKK